MTSGALPQTAAGGIVLFVDDEPRVLSGFRDTLRKEPYQLLTVNSASAALELLAEHQVDVVVSDEQMPIMCGSVFLEHVRQRYPNIVRIMLTGEASLAVSVQAINDGLYRFLGKPIQPDELRRVIRDALRMRALKAGPPRPPILRAR